MGQDDPVSIKKMKFGFIFFKLFCLVNKYLTESPAQDIALIEHGIQKEKIYLIPQFVSFDDFHGVSLDKKNELRKKYNIDKNGILITSIGRIGYRKGTDVTIKTFVKLNDKYPNVHLLLVGLTDKTPKELLNEISLIKSKNNNIHTMSRVDNIREIFNISDYFLLPSRNEGFGLVVIESMACNVPVVVSDLKGIFDSIVKQKHSGVIVHGFDPNDYAKAIESLLRDGAKKDRIINNAIENIQNNYSPDLIVKRFNQLFHELID